VAESKEDLVTRLSKMSYRELIRWSDSQWDQLLVEPLPYNVISQLRGLELDDVLYFKKRMVRRRHRGTK
jgi:hypothetical protein